MVQLSLFMVGSLLLIYVSRASLRAPRSHGFYRFWAWECLLGLFGLNVARWFSRPFSPPQLVSWLLLLVSAFLVVHGVSLLRRLGRPDEKRHDAEAPTLAFEKTTQLVTEGAYKYIRHPLYSSLFFLGWGMFLKNISWPAAALAVAATLFLVVTARMEEVENVRFFGATYQAYMRQTKMFVPFLF